ncbi:MAG: nucleotide pyrophosphohydrolase [Tissierellaceae bacterium]|nr:nucleotide pyrophosphohydrolase [Tissierellaceae bacterium]
MDRTTTIEEIKNNIATFVRERDWGKFHSPKNLSMSIAIEASELMEIFQWLSIDKSWEINNTKESTHLKEELSDVMIYCISLANQLDIDISKAIEDKIRKNALKYPVNK